MYYFEKKNSTFFRIYIMFDIQKLLSKVNIKLLYCIYMLTIYNDMTYLLC